MRETARAFVPLGLRRWIKRSHRDYVLARSIRRLRRILERGELPPEPLFADLVYGWGNESYSAQSGYLRTILQAAERARGPILECGSGLSTLILGLMAEANGRRVTSLEHSPLWAERLRTTLVRFRIRSVDLWQADLRDYGSYSWYVPPVDRLPAAFSLVVCDGPPGRTPGGRYGLLPVMGSRLEPGCLILLDDFTRPEERAIVSRWAAEYGVSDRASDPALELPDGWARTRRFTILTLPAR